MPPWNRIPCFDFCLAAVYGNRSFADLSFIPDEPVAITELHYNSSVVQGDDTAFIELTNRGNSPYDISEASFATGVNFTFPENTILAPGERVVIAADASHYAGLTNRVYDFAGTEKPTVDDPIWLRDGNGLEIDYVAYGTAAPWPGEPNNNGPTLMLIRPDLDNELPIHWAASDFDGGTPGDINFPPTVATNLQFSGGQVVTEWTGTISNAYYQLNGTLTLTSPAWQPVGIPVMANAASLMITDTNAAPQHFYRLTRGFSME